MTRNLRIVLANLNEPCYWKTMTTTVLVGQTDDIGQKQTKRAIVIGVRSQMSGVAKNCDKLMERAFAETLNLRLRIPSLTMGEVYVLPVVEHDHKAMIDNRVDWNRRPVCAAKFIRTFLAITNRAPDNLNQNLYEYERSGVPPVLSALCQCLLLPCNRSNEGL